MISTAPRSRTCSRAGTRSRPTPLASLDLRLLRLRSISQGPPSYRSDNNPIRKLIGVDSEPPNRNRGCVVLITPRSPQKFSGVDLRLEPRSGYGTGHQLGASGDEVTSIGRADWHTTPGQADPFPMFGDGPPVHADQARPTVPERLRQRPRTGPTAPGALRAVRPCRREQASNAASPPHAPLSYRATSRR